jgi:tetratricopeptide (TPR) repeat protein
MSTVEPCRRCGRPLTDGPCSCCAPDASVRVIHREFVLLSVLIATAVAGFLLTRTLALYNRSLRSADAMEWFERGQRELDAGRVATGAADLRHAVAMDPENASYQMVLARALGADARDAEAKQILVALREHQPEDPDINLQLARLENRAGEPDAAVRYYQGALAALWSPKDADARRQTRIELIKYLLGQQRRGRALAELLLLDADLPGDLDAQVAVGGMFLDAGDPRRAAARFGRILQQAPTNGEALAGAAAAAFALGQYQQALRFATAAPVTVPGVSETRTVTRLVLDRGPLAPRLGMAERLRRLATDKADLAAAIEQCLVPRGSAVESLETSTLRDLREELAMNNSPVSAAPARMRPVASRDDIEDGLDLLLRTVHARAAAGCSPPTGLDRAVELIAERHALEGK